MEKVKKKIFEEIVSSKSKTVVYPREFFISWNGVPTLAYQGFSPTLLEIKKEIDEKNKYDKKVLGLKEENSGSKWPKTTLGAIQDDKCLDRKDLDTLRKICDNMNAKIDKTKYFEIDELCVVLFICRSLEERLITYSIILDRNQERDIAYPPQKHKDEVDKVMEPFLLKNLDEYWNKVKIYGNREGYYRKPHIEATLVFDLPHPDKQPTYIKEFIDEVNNNLPDIYCWFSPESRHMTVRALSQYDMKIV
jgi:hypothetical protein